MKINSLSAEKYPGISPYTYTADNPVMLTDREGMAGEMYDWQPVKGLKNVWKAEKNDNYKTLARDAGISIEKAKELFKDIPEIYEGYYVATGEMELGDFEGVENNPVSFQMFEEHPVATTKYVDAEAYFFQEIITINLQTRVLMPALWI